MCLHPTQQKLMGYSARARVIAAAGARATHRESSLNASTISKVVRVFADEMHAVGPLMDSMMYRESSSGSEIYFKISKTLRAYIYKRNTRTPHKYFVCDL